MTDTSDLMKMRLMLQAQQGPTFQFSDSPNVDTQIATLGQNVVSILNNRRQQKMLQEMMEQEQVQQQLAQQAALAQTQALGIDPRLAGADASLQKAAYEEAQKAQGIAQLKQTIMANYGGQDVPVRPTDAGFGDLSYQPRIGGVVNEAQAELLARVSQGNQAVAQGLGNMVANDALIQNRLGGLNTNTAPGMNAFQLYAGFQPQNSYTVDNQFYTAQNNALEAAQKGRLLPYVAPQAQASLQGTLLGNQGSYLNNVGQQISNTYAPYMNDSTLQTAQLGRDKTQFDMDKNNAAMNYWAQAQQSGALNDPAQLPGIIATMNLMMGGNNPGGAYAEGVKQVMGGKPNKPIDLAGYGKKYPQPTPAAPITEKPKPTPKPPQAPPKPAAPTAPVFDVSRLSPMERFEFNELNRKRAETTFAPNRLETVAPFGQLKQGHLGSFYERKLENLIRKGRGLQ